MPELSGSSLVARCINGDRLAWNKFVERYSSLIFWAIKKRLSRAGSPYNQQDIEDIFQNVFVLLWEKGKLKQIKDREKVSGWLVMVAANCTRNYCRNKRATPASKEFLPQVTASSDCPATETDNQKELSETIEATLRSLAAREVIILKLNYLYNKTHQEIGKILKMPTNTVSSIIKRAKENLKETLKKEGWKDS